MAGEGCEEAQDHDQVNIGGLSDVQAVRLSVVQFGAMRPVRNAEILDIRLGNVWPGDLLDEGTVVVSITWRHDHTIELTTAPVAPYELSRQCDPDDPEHTPLGPAPRVSTFRAGHQDDRIRICRRT